MNPFLEALIIAVTGPLGVAVILLLAALAAAWLAERINPNPEQSVDEQIRLAVEHQEEKERMAAQLEELERVRGKESIDATHRSYPAFGIVFAIMLVLQSWAAALEHLETPEQGLPFALTLRPLWTSLIAALLAGLIAGVSYRHWYRTQPLWKRVEIAQRRKEKDKGRDELAFRDRLRSIRESGADRRRRSKDY